MSRQIEGEFNSTPVETETHLPRDNRGRIAWAALKDNPSELKNGVEQEAKVHLSLGIDISFPGLKSALLSGFAVGINDYYPGGMVALRRELGLPTRVQNSHWRKSENIEAEAQRLVFSGSNLTESSIKDASSAGFLRGVRKSYPGGLSALKEKMGVEPAQKPMNYWKNPETIKSEAIEMISQGHSLSDSSMSRFDKNSLAAAIRKYYPGGLKQLRTDLGQVRELRRPDGYWTVKNIEKEAGKFYEANGKLTQSDLRANNAAALASATRRYPGGMRALKEKLAIANQSHPKGYWTPEAVEAHALAVLEEEGSLSAAALKKRSRLSAAIANYYPGKMRALREKLGIESVQKPKDYWSEEQIEREALEFFQDEGGLSVPLLQGRKRFDLINAITSHYSGKLTTLRKKLAIRAFKEKKPYRYWQDQDNIKRELTELISRLGYFPSVNQIESMGMGGLRSAIVKSGGFRKWRAIFRSGELMMGPVNPDQANEQLARLTGVDTIGSI